MAKGDIQERIAQGLQPGIKPLGSGSALRPNMKPAAQPTDKGQHPIGPRKSLTNFYNNGSR